MLIVTPSEMEAIDRETISHYGLPSQVLMENAARTVLPYVPPGPVKLLIGPGNNGGDGLVLARALQEQGRDVEALLFSKTLSKEAETQRQLALNWGVPMRSFYNDDDTRTPRFLENGVIIDALFGTGLARELTGRYARTLEVANRSNAYRLAIDIPSGIDGTTGKVLSTAFQADLTVTFGRIKWGQLLFPGKTHCGQTVLTQPGFHPEALKKFERAQYVEHSLAAKLLPQTWPTMHKGDNGRVLLLTGSENYPGAGVLSTLGALRGGAGLVSLAANDTLRQAVTTHAPEAILINREHFEIDSFHALVLGSGLGDDSERYGSELLSRFSGPVVVDADALALVSRFPLQKRRQWVLTPHPGELSRLLGRSVAELEKNRIQTALDAAESLGCIVCFKGAPTVCASPEGRVFVNSSGNPILAQGGSGDVLAGLVGAYIGYGLPLLEASAAAVYIHGLAADLMAEEGLAKGSGARALAERIPRAFAQTVGKD